VGLFMDFKKIHLQIFISYSIFLVTTHERTKSKIMSKNILKNLIVKFFMVKIDASF